MCIDGDATLWLRCWCSVASVCDSCCRSHPTPIPRCAGSLLRRFPIAIAVAPPPPLLPSYPHSHSRSHIRPCSLYVKGAFLGYCRAQRKQSQNKHLLSIDGVKSTADSAFYMGKRVAYIYRAKAVVKGTHYRVIWGRIARPHGSNGVVRAYFRSNLPPRAMGASVRVMLYPSRV